MPAFLVGGGQENGMRSGTQNVLGCVVQARAFEKAVRQREEVWQRIAGLRRQVVEACACGEFPHALKPVLAPSEEQVPHVLALLADGLEGQTVVLRADDEGIALSSGSACSSRSLDPSHVLTALGIDRDLAYGEVRVSFGALTTQRDVDMLITALPRILR